MQLNSREQRRESLKGQIRWRAKALIQGALAVVPGGVELNHRLQIWNGSFRRDRRTPRFVYQSAQVGDFGRRKGGLEGAVVVEIGSGWDFIGAIIFHLAGASAFHAFDLRVNLDLRLAKDLILAVGQDVAAEVAACLASDPEEVRGKLDRLAAADTTEGLLRALGAHYHAPGDARRTGLPTESVDVVFSYGSLEHIPGPDLAEILAESRRILRPDGLAYHNIGTHDHFEGAGAGSAVNFLRYSEIQWRILAGNKFAYHNRLRMSDYLRMFEDAGLQVTFQRRELLERNLEALAHMRVHRSFAGRSPEDLATSELCVDLARAGAAAA